MRKLFIFIMILSITLFISCGNKTNDMATENNKGNEAVNPKENESSIGENNNVQESADLEKKDDVEESNEPIEEESESKVQYYLDKYAKLEKELKDSLEEKYNGTTLDMREAASIEYTSWDDLLNEVYGVLQEQLSKEEMDKLREEQIEWLTIRDSKAEESAKEFEGGTMEPLAYTTSLAQSTKERCYELISNYIKFMSTDDLSFSIPNKNEIA